jgi:putative transposase of IS4/5 family DUF4096/RAMP superfamily protein
MRFWFRALMGGILGDQLSRLRNLESYIFGETECASAIALRVAELRISQKNAGDDVGRIQTGMIYLGFPFYQWQRESRTDRLSGNIPWQKSRFMRSSAHILSAAEGTILDQKDRPRKTSPSDLTDESWAIVEPLLPPPQSSPRGWRPRQGDRRDVLHTVFDRKRSGGPWDM